MSNAVTPERIKIAKDFGLANTKQAALACRVADLPFFAACALLEKESGGRNKYGESDGPGAALSGYPEPVDESNFKVFLWLLSNGQQSNGVGPCQITWPGYFTDMANKGLHPWRPLDNMTFGFGVLAKHYAATHSWVKAGEAYNNSHGYGVDLAEKVTAWRHRLGIGD